MDQQLVSSAYRTDRKVSAGYLFFLLGAMVIFAAVLGLFVEPIVRLLVRDSAYQVITSQIIGSVLIFFVPPWVTEFYHRRRSESFLYRLRREDTDRRSLLWVAVVYLLAIPLVGFLAHIMEILPVPLGLREYLEASEALIEETMAVMMGDKRPLSMLLVVLSLAVLTPIVEEFFFRGAIQGWALSRALNKHLVVWMVALIFSLVHFEWDGMLARWALGVMLGYAALYGGLWASIVLHMLNNFVAVLSLYFLGSELDFIPRSRGELLLISLSSALSIIGIALIFNSMKKTLCQRGELNKIDKSDESE
ncbi:MAG: CPBP family intramembrane metalloprotease [Porphyromonas sp.]|nr:CPBP family intramembrane metalloprotease [Porphyromonas sp.]